MSAIPDFEKERFLSMAPVRPDGSCWPWFGTRTRKGYGHYWIGGKNRAAHRVAYEMFVGPIGRGLLICHRCDNPPCVNPAHLFAGTNTDNMRDSSLKGRRPQQRVTHCPSGHEYTPENTGYAPRKTDGFQSFRYCRACRRKRQEKYNHRRDALRRADRIERGEK